MARNSISVTRQEGTYSVVSTPHCGDHFHQARDEIRTFTVDTAKRAVTLLSSVGYLNWTFIEMADAPTDRLRIAVRYPEGVMHGDVVEFSGYGCSVIESTVEDGPVGVIQAANVPAFTPITCRTVFQRR